MRILFLQAFPLWGCGSGTDTRNLAKELGQKKRHQVAVLCPESRVDKTTRKIPFVKTYPLELPFPVAFTGHPEWPVVRLYKDLNPDEITRVFRYFIRGAVEAVEHFKPDIIHAQHISLFLWTANLIKSLYDINFVANVHGTGVYTASQNKSYIPLCQDGLRRAKKIICNSNDSKKKLLETFGEEFKPKTRIIPGGIDLEKFPKELKIKIINKKHRLKGFFKSKKVVLFTGKVTLEKGVNYLIKAAENIKGEIYIIGDGPELNKLKDEVNKENLQNVHFLGYMGKDQAQEFHEFYYRADVFVTPSIWAEPLGLVILEAMAARTPVVATRKGGIPLAVKDNVNGILVRARSSKQIAEAVNKLLENDNLRKKLGENARKMVEEKFTWNKIAKKWEAIYKEHFNHIRKNNKK